MLNLIYNIGLIFCMSSAVFNFLVIYLYLYCILPKYNSTLDWKFKKKKKKSSRSTVLEDLSSFFDLDTVKVKMTLLNFSTKETSETLS